MNPRPAIHQLILLCVAVAGLGIFLPWVRIEPRKAPTTSKQQTIAAKPTTTRVGRSVENSELGRTMKKAFGSLGKESRKVSRQIGRNIPQRITGVQIPQLANSEMTRTTMSLVERIKKKREHVGLKSYAVYLLPLLALLLGGGLWRFGYARRWVALPLAALAAAVAVGGAWQLLTLRIVVPGVTVSFEYGLWLSLAAYAGLAIGGAASGFPERAAGLIARFTRHDAAVSGTAVE